MRYSSAWLLVLLFGCVGLGTVAVMASPPHRATQPRTPHRATQPRVGNHSPHRATQPRQPNPVRHSSSSVHRNHRTHRATPHHSNHHARPVYHPPHRTVHHGDTCHRDVHYDHHGHHYDRHCDWDAHHGYSHNYPRPYYRRPVSGLDYYRNPYFGRSYRTTSLTVGNRGVRASVSFGQIPVVPVVRSPAYCDYGPRPCNYDARWGYGDPCDYRYDRSPHGTYYNPRGNRVEYFLPPTYYPGGLMYGPQATKEFWGLDRNFALGPLLNRPAPLVLPANLPVPNRPAVRPKIVIPRSTARDRAIARHRIAVADAQFHAQRYAVALQDYRKASADAGDLAEPYFKQAIVLMIQGKDDAAARAICRAIDLDAEWVRGPFRLDRLYKDTHIAKQAHLEALARRVLKNPNRSGPIYVLAVLLYFDGQQERAQPFFRHAAKLAGSDTYTRPFRVKKSVTAVEF